VKLTERRREITRERERESGKWRERKRDGGVRLKERKRRKKF